MDRKSDKEAMAYLKLVQAVMQPDLEEVWYDGMMSAKDHEPIENNPYQKNTPEYHHWQEGWWDGFSEPSEVTQSVPVQKASWLSKLSMFGSMVLGLTGTMLVYELGDAML